MPKKAVATFARAHPKTGEAVVISEDDVYADDDPLVQVWGDMFVDLMDTITVNKASASFVEQATAAPGEKRGVGRPPRRAV